MALAYFFKVTVRHAHTWIIHFKLNHLFRTRLERTFPFPIVVPRGTPFCSRTMASIIVPLSYQLHVSVSSKQTDTTRKPSHVMNNVSIMAKNQPMRP